MSVRSTGTDLLDRLEGRACPDEECLGTLERGPFKDSEAVVCTDCSTPVVRLWLS